MPRGVTALGIVTRPGSGFLLQLFPDYETSNFREFNLSAGERVRIDVIERCRYTTCLKVTQQGGLTGWLSSPQFELRVYAESGNPRDVAVRCFSNLLVVGCQGRFEHGAHRILAG